jgi:hypothetical protein
MSTGLNRCCRAGIVTSGVICQLPLGPLLSQHSGGQSACSFCGQREYQFVVSLTLLSWVKAVLVVTMDTVALVTLLSGTFGNGTLAKPENPYRVIAVCGLRYSMALATSARRLLAHELKTMTQESAVLRLEILFRNLTAVTR